MSHIFAILLLVVHGGLGVWALMGFAELILPTVPWSRISNPAFQTPMLVVQWTLVATAAALYIGGYLSRWHYTPVAMACVYCAMALTCAYQTFFVLTNSNRFVAMAIEYAEYAVILFFLFRSASMRAHFGM